MLVCSQQLWLTLVQQSYSSSVLLQDTEEQVGKSSSSSQGYGNKTQTSLVMDESWKEGTMNQAILNPLASISGDAVLGFTRWGRQPMKEFVKSSNLFCLYCRTVL